MIKHYEGEIGNFDYDDEEFRLGLFDFKNIFGEISEFVEKCVISEKHTKPNLLYIGKETDGNKIAIPEGVSDLAFTFAESNIKTPPKIPTSVESIYNAFRDCEKLTKTPYIPLSVEFCSSAFQGCKSLESVENLPKETAFVDGMFKDCDVLKNIPEDIIKKPLRFIKDMFSESNTTLTDNIESAFEHKEKEKSVEI